MGEQTTADLSRRIAELVGDEGFLPAAKCPEGHNNTSNGLGVVIPRQIGQLCDKCVSEGARQHEHIPDHPEWRIQRGGPKPYAEDPSLLIPLVEQWFAKQPGIELEITVVAEGGMLRRYLRVYSGVVLGLMRVTGVDEFSARRVNTADEFTSALADIWLVAVERWGRDA